MEGEKGQIPAACERRCPWRSAGIAVTTMASWLAATGGRARLTPAATIDFGAVILYGRASRSGQRHGHLPRPCLLPAPVSASYCLSSPYLHPLCMVLLSLLSLLHTLLHANTYSNPSVLSSSSHPFSYLVLFRIFPTGIPPPPSLHLRLPFSSFRPVPSCLLQAPPILPFRAFRTP